MSTDDRHCEEIRRKMRSVTYINYTFSFTFFRRPSEGGATCFTLPGGENVEPGACLDEILGINLSLQTVQV